MLPERHVAPQYAVTCRREQIRQQHQHRRFRIPAGAVRQYYSASIRAVSIRDRRLVQKS
jgi:hypothetical protein